MRHIITLLLASVCFIASTQTKQIISNKIAHDSIHLIEFIPDIRLLFTSADTVKIKDYYFLAKGNEYNMILDLGPMGNGVDIIKIDSSRYLLKFYSNLPLNGIDSSYLKTEMVNFNLIYLHENELILIIDKKFRPKILWSQTNINNTIVKWKELVADESYQQTIWDLTDDKSGELLNLNYALFYSILSGNTECIPYFTNSRKLFPAIDQLTLHMDYYSNWMVLYYYGYIDHYSLK